MLKSQVEDLLDNVNTRSLMKITQLWRGDRPLLRRDEDLAARWQEHLYHRREGFEQFHEADRRRREFEASSQYQRWLYSEISNILALIGYQQQSIAYKQYTCWVSPIALDLIRQQGLQGDVHAYYFLPIRQKTGLSEIMTSLLVQLLGARLKELRECIGYFCSEGVEGLEALEKIAMRVIEMFEQCGIVHITIDRVDKCEEHERMSLLDLLGRMIKEARCTVNVLVVINGSDCVFRETGRLVRWKWVDSLKLRF